MLFEEVVFGPIHSRRLGVSLGINLLSSYVKFCNFNCIYCECGWNVKNDEKKKFHTRAEVSAALENKLQQMNADGKMPDSITFSGNGEPTLNPEFAEIIDDTISLRNKYATSAKISVLTNATMISRPSVYTALQKVDNAILKLDSAFDETVYAINQPQFKYSVEEVIKNMQAFKGKMILQTMFLRGTATNGAHIDNTTTKEIEAWIEAAKRINPSEITIYTIDREPPAKNLQKVSFDELDKIGDTARAAGFKVQVAKK